MSMPPSNGKRRRWVALACMCFIIAGGVYVYFSVQRLLAPMLVIFNDSGSAITAIAFHDARSRGVASEPGSWTSLPAGARIVHRLRGDPVVEISYVVGGQVHTYSQFTPVGLLEAWVVRIKPDGSADGTFGQTSDY